MRRGKGKSDPVKFIKTSITLPEKLAAFGERRRVERNFASFSSYLASLIQAELDRQTADATSSQRAVDSAAFDEILPKPPSRHRRGGPPPKE